MGQQIIEQPDGRYAVYDSTSGTLIVTDATTDELIEWRAEEAADQAREQTRRELDRVQNRPRPYAQYTLTWHEALARHAEHGGTLP